MSTVPVGGGGRLKGFCSMAAPQTIAHGSSDGARRAIKVGDTGGGGTRRFGGDNAGLGIKIPVWG